MNQRVTAIRLIVASTLMCIGLWLIARWLAMQLALAPKAGGILAFCAVWIALYPFARRNTAAPSWMHWAGGVFVLVVVWLFTRLAG